MEKVSEADRQEWITGRISFRDLLVRYQCAATDLAVALEIPLGDKVIAVRHAWDWWMPQHTQAILLGRQAYDAGLVELVQGRYFGHFFLFALTRKRVGAARRYFSLPGNGIEIG